MIDFLSSHGLHLPAYLTISVSGVVPGGCHVGAAKI
jgi:hypothetical protein